MAESNEQRIGRILGKLNQVRKRGVTCFGAVKHNFRLNPTLDEASVSDFERQHAIRLPADFRNFLMLAGDGGAGPYYGIYRLNQWNEMIDLVSEDLPDNLLALPSPLRPELLRDKGWEWQLGSCVSPYQGMITIGTQGCTYAMGLIVTGEYAGRVVYFDADGEAPYVVREPDFLSWYERWLDELLGGYDMHSFGYGLGGDEPHLLGLLENTATTEADRIDAIYALRRLPQLSSRGRDGICGLLRDRADGVRAASCYVVEKFEIAEAKEFVAKLLDDHAPEVQQAAIRASTKLKVDGHREKLLQMLQSENLDVAKRAFFEFKGEKIPRDILLQLVDSPHGEMRHLAAHAIKWQPEDTDLLIRLLRDKHSQVRFHSVLGLRQLRAATALDAVIELLGRESEHNTIDAILHLLGEVHGSTNADVLLEWASGTDDFHRLAAVDSLCKLGDERVGPMAKLLLAETRSPARLDSHGLPAMWNAQSIRDLVGSSLRGSPNSNLQRLASGFRWPKWLTFK